MSSGAVSGKNMSQNESLAPSGRAPYFMSVMYWWLPTNGPIQNADRSTTARPTVRPYHRRRHAVDVDEHDDERGRRTA